MAKLIVANWKLHPSSVSAAKKLFLDVKKALKGVRGVDVVVAPSHLYVEPLSHLALGKTITIGAQDVFWENKGSYTGEISPTQLRDLKISYCIVGHSERRRLGETDEMVARKIQALLKVHVHPILCVGELERDQHGNYLSFLERQIVSAFTDVPSTKAKNIIIAYEPLWAIGKSAKDAINSHSLHETILFIRKVLSHKYSNKVAFSVRILYGGSVEAENASGLLSDDLVGGALVGHASLKPTEFARIVRSA